MNRNTSKPSKHKTAYRKPDDIDSKFTPAPRLVSSKDDNKYDVPHVDKYGSVQGSYEHNEPGQQPLHYTHKTRPGFADFQNTPSIGKQSRQPGGFLASAIYTYQDATRYRFRKEHSSFFVIGRVLACIWGQAMSATVDEADSVSRSNPDDEEYTKVSFMVVVQTFHGHCICVQVNTHKGRGASKRGIVNNDLRQMAKIYPDGESDAYMRIESQVKHLLQHPFPVDLADGSWLHDASRIRFDHVMTLEYNIKVHNVGRVSNGHVSRLQDSWFRAMKHPADTRDTEDAKHSDRALERPSFTDPRLERRDSGFSNDWRSQRNFERLEVQSAPIDEDDDDYPEVNDHRKSGLTFTKPVEEQGSRVWKSDVPYHKKGHKY